MTSFFSSTNIFFHLEKTLFVIEPKRQLVLPDSMIFFISGSVLNNDKMKNLSFHFSLEDEGSTLLFIEVDDPVYFSCFDVSYWVQQMVDLIKQCAGTGLGVYAYGQLSGPPKAILGTREAVLNMHLNLLKPKDVDKLPQMRQKVFNVGKRALTFEKST